jgi:hypothetical protein
VQDPEFNPHLSKKKEKEKIKEARYQDNIVYDFTYMKCPE